MDARNFSEDNVAEFEALVDAAAAKQQSCLETVVERSIEPAAPRARLNVRLVEQRNRAALQNLLIQHHTVQNTLTWFRNQPFSPWKFNQNLDHVVSSPPRHVGMVVFDANGDGKITSSKEFVFTEWANGARTDFEALKQVFDTNHNGQLDAGDARFGEFRVSVNGELKTFSPVNTTQIVVAENDNWAIVNNQKEILNRKRVG